MSPKAATQVLGLGSALSICVLAWLAVACGQVTDDGLSAGGVGGAGGTGLAGAGGSAAGSANAGSSAGGIANGGSGVGGVAQGGAAHGGSGAGGTPGGSGGGSGNTTEGYVVRKVFLGDTTRDGQADSHAWQQFGVDLDGLYSTKEATNHCVLAYGSNPARLKSDGPGGIDNSFGQNLLPILLGIYPTLPTTVERSIADGRSLALLTGPSIHGLDIFASMGRAKSHSGSYDVSQPWAVFEAGYPPNDPRCPLEGSGSDGKLMLSGAGYWELHLPANGGDVVIRIHEPRVVGDLPAGSQHIENAILAGVILTEELIDAVFESGGFLDPQLCAPSVQDSIAAQLRAASDIRHDLQNGDPNVECDAISFGIGVELDPVLIDGITPGEAVANGCN